MSQTATASAINSLIDTNSANLKAQIDANAAALKAQIAALTFYDAPVTVKAPVVVYAAVSPLTQGVAMSAVTPSNTGDSATFSGTLPAGLSLNPTTGAITGTPTAVGSGAYSITATNAGGTSNTSVSITVNAPAVVAPTPSVPGGKVSGPLTYSNQSNLTISGLSIDGGGKSVDLITVNNCTNVHITLCRFSNTNGNSITLNGCTNVTVDYCFFTMVNFGVYALNCISTKVNNNQGLNRWAPVLYGNNFSHWVQFNKCSGAGQQVNNNVFEDVVGVAVHPHDTISIYSTSGTAASPVQVNGNKIRGGQQVAWPNPGDIACGITAPDSGGSYYEVRNNILVNTAGAGIQAPGSGENSILIDGNICYNNIVNSVASNGIIILGSHSNTVISNNRVWWLNKNNKAVKQSDGETGYYLGNPTGSLAGVTIASNNNWLDTTLSASILPTTIITYK